MPPTSPPFTSLILLSVTIVLALVAASCALGVLVPWAKGVMFVANLALLVAFILVPFGFDELSNACPGVGHNEAQCGLG